MLWKPALMSRRFLSEFVCKVTTLVVATSLVVDKVTPLLGIENKLILCLIDNSGHALISGEVWLAGLYSRHTTYRDQRGYSQEKFYFDIRAKELIGALLLGSMLDFDHFFAANAMSLTAATTLHSRPKGHAVLFVVLAMFLCFFIASLTLPPRKRCYRYRLALLVGVSLFSHQLRDATRRGLWLYPLDKNIPVSYSGYLMGLFCIVCSVHYLSMNVSKFSHVTMSSQEVSDSFGVYPPDSV